MKPFLKDGDLRSCSTTPPTCCYGENFFNLPPVRSVSGETHCIMPPLHIPPVRSVSGETLSILLPLHIPSVRSVSGETFCILLPLHIPPARSVSGETFCILLPLHKMYGKSLVVVASDLGFFQIWQACSSTAAIFLYFADRDLFSEHIRRLFRHIRCLPPPTNYLHGVSPSHNIRRHSYGCSPTDSSLLLLCLKQDTNPRGMPLKAPKIYPFTIPSYWSHRRRDLVNLRSPVFPLTVGIACVLDLQPSQLESLVLAALLKAGWTQYICRSSDPANASSVSRSRSLLHSQVIGLTLEVQVLGQLWSLQLMGQLWSLQLMRQILMLHLLGLLGQNHMFTSPQPTTSTSLSPCHLRLGSPHADCFCFVPQPLDIHDVSLSFASVWRFGTMAISFLIRLKTQRSLENATSPLLRWRLLTEYLIHHGSYELPRYQFSSCRGQERALPSSSFLKERTIPSSSSSVTYWLLYRCPGVTGTALVCDEVSPEASLSVTFKGSANRCSVTFAFAVESRIAFSALVAVSIANTRPLCVLCVSNGILSFLASLVVKARRHRDDRNCLRVGIASIDSKRRELHPLSTVDLDAGETYFLLPPYDLVVGETSYLVWHPPPRLTLVESKISHPPITPQLPIVVSGFTNDESLYSHMACFSVAINSHLVCIAIVTRCTFRMSDSHSSIYISGSIFCKSELLQLFFCDSNGIRPARLCSRPTCDHPFQGPNATALQAQVRTFLETTENLIILVWFCIQRWFGLPQGSNIHRIKSHSSGATLTIWRASSFLLLSFILSCYHFCNFIVFTHVSTSVPDWLSISECPQPIA